MGRYDEVFTQHWDFVDDVLKETDNPAHHRILKNARRHGLLEISGRYRELLAPDMTVEHPVYRLYDGAESVVLDGMDAVAGFYQSLIDHNTLVMWIENPHVQVSSWGFSGEMDLCQFKSGAQLLADGTDPALVDDPDAAYLTRRRHATAWPYAEDGRLIGEHVYAAGATEIVKVDPADVITRERAAELLAPVLERATL